MQGAIARSTQTMGAVNAARSGRLRDAARWPRILAACCLVCLPFQMETNYGIRVAPADLIAAIGCVVTLLTKRRSQKSRSNGALLGLWFAMTVALLTTLIETGGLSRYVLLNKYCGLFWLFTLYWFFTNAARDKADVLWLMKVFVIAVAVQNCVCLAAYIAGHWFGISIPFFNPWPRLSGFYLDPNGYGGLLACALGLHLFTFRSAAALVRGKTGACLLVTLAAGIVFTFSRSAGIACAALGIIGVLFRPRLVIPYAAILAILGGASWVYLAGTADRSFIVDMAKRPKQIDVRVQLAAAAIEDFKANPMLGIGLGQFGTKETNIIHNTSLWFLAEMGVVGFAAWCWFLGSTTANALLCLRSPDAVIKRVGLALLGAHAAMVGLSVGVESLYQRHWWFVLAMISILSNITTQERLHLIVRHIQDGETLGSGARRALRLTNRVADVQRRLSP